MPVYCVGYQLADTDILQLKTYVETLVPDRYPLPLGNIYLDLSFLLAARCNKIILSTVFHAYTSLLSGFQIMW